ncbi:MAG: glycosyltransferase family 4 protein [Pontiella sp.]
MKIIQVHNYYQRPGGEDSVVSTERSMLEAHGHKVVPYYKNNEALGTGLWALGKASLQTLWNGETYKAFRKLLQNETPDVVHCHNTFPLISPSVYWACAKENVPVVQTLHNYRLLCLNAFLFRKADAVSNELLAISPASEVTDNFHEKIVTERNGSQKKAKSCELNAKGTVCELCVSKRFKWPGVRYGCYRDSKAGSLVIAMMLLFHKLIGTWSKKVTAYIALTEFQKQKMMEGGLPAEKIFVKPNFIDGSLMKEPLATSQQPTACKPESSAQCPVPDASQRYALFVGRLSPEKGCDVLVRAWAGFQKELLANSCELSADQIPQLLIVGDGPEREALESLSSALGLPSSVSFLGQQPKESVLSLMRNAYIFIFPSVWYETFGLTVLEAGLCETPSLVSSPTTTSGLISDKESGLLFSLGDDLELAERLEWAFLHPEEMREVGETAKRNFEKKYSSTTNYNQLMEIYQSIIRKR